MRNYFLSFILVLFSLSFIEQSDGKLNVRQYISENETDETSALRKLVVHMALNIEEMDLEVKKLRNSCAMKSELQDLAAQINETGNKERNVHDGGNGNPVVNPQYQHNASSMQVETPFLPSVNMSSMEQMLKLLVRASCYEWKQAGFTESGNYHIDPDGQGIGDPPFSVYCDMITGFTFVRHNMERQQEAEQCQGPGCSVAKISYTATQEQIKALMYTSHSCQQFIGVNCKQSPLREQGVDLAWWKGVDGVKHYEWAGESYPSHSCTCGYTFACVYPQESCNCDANIPDVWLSDSGYVTNASVLPIQEIAFGSSHSGSPAEISYSVGPLRCHGTKDIAYPRSCLELFTGGTQQSGWYLIGEPASVALSFCDMDYPEQEPIRYSPSSDQVVEHGTPVRINFADLLTHHLHSKGLAISTTKEVLQLKESQASMESQLSLVTDKIRTLSENLKKHQSTTESEKEAYTDQLKELEQKIQESQNISLAHSVDIETLHGKLSLLSSFGVAENKKIIFHAMKQLGFQSSISTITYETVDINIGDGYDRSTGKFTAPIAGIYYIAAYARRSTDLDMYFHICHNKGLIALARIRSGSPDQSTGVSTIVNLSIGDEVYIQISMGRISGASDGGTSFMGYLISK